MSRKGKSTLLIALILLPSIAVAASADSTYYDEDKQVTFKNWGAAIHYYGYPTKYHKLLDKWLPSPINDTGVDGDIYNISTEGGDVYFSDSRAGYFFNSSRSSGNMSLEFSRFGLFDELSGATATIVEALADIPDNQIILDSAGLKVTYEDIPDTKPPHQDLIMADIEFKPSTYGISKKSIIESVDHVEMWDTYGAGMTQIRTFFETTFKLDGVERVFINGAVWDGVNSTVTYGEIRLKIDRYEYLVVEPPTAEYSNGLRIHARFRVFNESGDIYISTMIPFNRLNTVLFGEYPIYICPTITSKANPDEVTAMQMQIGGAVGDILVAGWWSKGYAVYNSTDEDYHIIINPTTRPAYAEILNGYSFEDGDSCDNSSHYILIGHLGGTAWENITYRVLWINKTTFNIDDYYTFVTNYTSEEYKMAIRPQGDYFILGARSHDPDAHSIIRFNLTNKTWDSIGLANSTYCWAMDWHPSGDYAYIATGNSQISTYYHGASKVSADNIAVGSPLDHFIAGLDCYWNTTYPYMIAGTYRSAILCYINLTDYSSYLIVDKMNYRYWYHIDFVDEGTGREIAICALRGGDEINEWNGTALNNLISSFYTASNRGTWDKAGYTHYIASYDFFSKISYINTPAILNHGVDLPITKSSANLTGTWMRDRETAHTEIRDIEYIEYRLFHWSGEFTGWIKIENYTNATGEHNYNSPTGSFNATIDLTDAPEGNFYTFVRAYNGIYHSATLRRGGYTFDKPPEVSDVAFNGNRTLEDNITLSGEVNITGNVSWIDGEAQLFWRVDSETWAEALLDENGSWYIEIDTSRYENGEHSLTLRTMEDGQETIRTFSILFNNPVTTEPSAAEPTPTPPPKGDEEISAYYFVVPLGIALIIALLVFMVGRASKRKGGKRRGYGFIILPMALFSLLALVVMPAPATAYGTSEEIWIDHWNMYDHIDISPSGEYGVVVMRNLSNSHDEIWVWHASNDTMVKVYDNPTDYQRVRDTEFITDYVNWVMHSSGDTSVAIDCLYNIAGDLIHSKDRLDLHRVDYNHQRDRVWFCREIAPMSIQYRNLSSGGLYTCSSGIYCAEPRDIEVNTAADVVYCADGLEIEYFNASIDWDLIGQQDWPTLHDMSPYMTHINDIEMQYTSSGNYLWVAGGSNAIKRLTLSPNGMYITAIVTRVAYPPISNVLDMQIDSSNRFVAYTGQGSGLYTLAFYDTQLGVKNAIFQWPDTVWETLFPIDWWSDGEIKATERWIVAPNRVYGGCSMIRFDMGYPYCDILTANNSVFTVDEFYINCTFTQPYGYNLIEKLAIIDETMPFGFYPSWTRWPGSPPDQYTTTITGLSEGVHSVGCYAVDEKALTSAIKYINIELDYPPTINYTYPATQFINETTREIGGNISLDAIEVNTKINDGDWALANKNSYNWWYIVPTGYSGVLDIYIKVWDGTSYSTESHRQFIMNVTGEIPEPTPTPTPSIDVTVAGKEVVLETSQILLILTGITAFSALIGVLVTTSRRKKRR